MNREQDQTKISHSLDIRIKRLFATGDLSDVSFKIEETSIKCHKMILASLSPVFKAQFYTDHNQSTTEREEIEIEGLAKTGFVNMIRYIYGYKVDQFELMDLYETLVSADKYLVYNIGDDIISHIRKMLNQETLCPIIDQLIQMEALDILTKTNNGVALLEELKYNVQFNSSLVFESDHFLHISLSTLIYLLKLPILEIKEIDVLKRCYDWATFHHTAFRTKQQIFEHFKEYVKFSRITFEEYREFQKIQEVLPADEWSSIFLHLSDHTKKISVDCKTIREYPELIHLSNKGFHDGKKYDSFQVKVKSNRMIAIKTIQTSLFKDTQHVNLQILINDQTVSPEWEQIINDGYIGFEMLTNPLRVSRDDEFTLKFTFAPMYCDQLGSRISNHQLSNGDCVIELEPLDEFHYIEGLKFFML